MNDSMPITDAASQPKTGKRFLGFIDLNPGVSLGNIWTFYLACFTGIMLAAFGPQLQPLILTEFLNTPASQLGSATGTLGFAGELAIILTTGFWGVLSDKVGRRPLMAGGYVVLAFGFYLFPNATTLNELIVARVIFSVGIGAFSCIIITLLADYVNDRSRGKSAGLLGVANGLGAVISVLFLVQLPAIFETQGMTIIEAGFATYYVATAIAFFTGIAMWFGLKKEEVIQNTKDDSESMLELTKQALLAARDPGVALAYGSSFIARSNVALVGSYFILWLSKYGTTNLEMTTSDAIAKAGLVLAAAQLVALLSAGFFGVMTDRMNRVNALIITLVIATAGYGGTYFITDPFSWGMYICAALIGMAEVGCIITSAVLIAQQTPIHVRGSVMGFFNLSGAVGILISLSVGGYLFDNWMYQGPFIFVGLIAFLVLVWAIIVRKKIVPLNEDTDGALAAH